MQKTKKKPTQNVNNLSNISLMWTSKQVLARKWTVLINGVKSGLDISSVLDDLALHK